MNIQYFTKGNQMTQEHLEVIDVLRIATSPEFITLELVMLLFICIIIYLIFRDHLTGKAEDDRNIIKIDISKRHTEIIDEDMSIDEILLYFKENYGFNVGEDSVKILTKAQEYLDRIKDHYREAKLVLYSIELGVCDREKMVTVLNECGGYMLLSSHELDIMFNMFSHLYEKDKSYQDELKTINEIRVEYGDIEKKLINVCLTMITECPKPQPTKSS